MASKGRQTWFTDIVTAALGESIMEADDVTKHATPDVLAESLPADLMSKVLQAALSSGSMTPKVILETLTPALLSAHVPHPVLWESVESVAKRAGLAEASEGGNGVGDARRRFLQVVLESGLANECVTADDVLAHATPDVLATHLPPPLKAKMLSAGLAANALNPQLIVDTLGVEDLSTHLPIRVLWSCGQQAAARSLGDADAADVGAALNKPLSPPVPTAPARAKTATGGSKTASTKTKAKTKGKSRAKSKADAQSFDEDTRVGEEAKWVADDDFEVLEEAEAVGAGDILAGDWSGDEQTDAGANLGNGRR